MKAKYGNNTCTIFFFWEEKLILLKILPVICFLALCDNSVPTYFKVFFEQLCNSLMMSSCWPVSLNTNVQVLFMQLPWPSPTISTVVTSLWCHSANLSIHQRWLCHQQTFNHWVSMLCCHNRSVFLSCVLVAFYTLYFMQFIHMSYYMQASSFGSIFFNPWGKPGHLWSFYYIV